MRREVIQASSSPWIVRPRPLLEARARLFCFPYAGGGPSAFRSWVAALPEGLECCLVQLPGKESRVLEPPLLRLEPIVTGAYEAVEPLLDRPAVFFGHSMGGKVAFELARALRRRGLQGPRALIISATRAPDVPDPDPPVCHLSDDDFVTEIQSRYDAIPNDVLDNHELLELILPGLRADFEAMETHVHREEAPLDCPIVCIGGEDDDRVGEAGLRAWERQTTSGFTLTLFPGGHFFIASEADRVVTFLADTLTELLRP